jgi:hypothetical protein
MFCSDVWSISDTASPLIGFRFCVECIPSLICIITTYSSSSSSSSDIDISSSSGGGGGGSGCNNSTILW